MRRTLVLRSLALCLVAQVGAAGAARADEVATDATAARELFDRGVALLHAGRVEEACPVLEQSLARYPGNGTRGKLAECYEREGRVASAWRTYREVARVAGEAGDLVRKRVADERAEVLAPKLGHLVVVPPPGAPPGLVVTRDGAPFTTLDAPAPTDAGLVTLSASAPGRARATMQVRVVDGLVTRAELPALASEAEVAPPPPVAPREPLPEPQPAAPSPKRTQAWRTPVALAAAGAGLAAIGVGIGFAVSAKRGYDGAFDGEHCDPASRACDAAGQAATDRARARANVATGLVVAGAAVAAAGIVVKLTAPHRRAVVGNASLTVAGTGASLAIPF